MKIAFLSTIQGYPWGGADAIWTRAAEAACARGDQLLIAATAPVLAYPRIAALVAHGAQTVTRASAGERPSYWQRQRARVLRYFRDPDPVPAALTRFAPELVIVSQGGTYDLLAEPAWMAWLRATRTPYRLVVNMQLEHPALPEPDRHRARDILAGAERLFFVSSRNLAVTRAHLLHPLAQAVRIDGSPVHNPLPAPGTPSTRWTHPPPWGFAVVARLEPVKGVDLLLHALHAALPGEPDWRLNIYGKGEQRDFLEATARELGLADHVRLHGFVADFSTVWRDNHLFVSPALEEGIPLTVPEALMYGRAVLACDIGGTPDWVKDGENGYVCPAPTVPLLAATIRRAWADRTRWEEMGRLAAPVAQARFRPDDHLKLIT